MLVYRNINTVKALVDNKADPKTTTKGATTALLLAAEKGHSLTCQYLVEKKADHLRQDIRGKTAHSVASPDVKEAIRRGMRLQSSSKPHQIVPATAIIADPNAVVGDLNVAASGQHTFLKSYNAIMSN